MRNINLDQLQQISLKLQIPNAIIENAACKNVDPIVMDGETIPDIHAARGICMECPVRQLCQEWAVWHEPNSVKTGMTPSDLKLLRKRDPPINIKTLQICRIAMTTTFGKD